MQTWEDYDTQRDKRFVWSQAMPSIDGAAGIFSAENWQPELHNRLAPSSFPTFLDQDWRRTVMSHMSRGSKYNNIINPNSIFRQLKNINNCHLAKNLWTCKTCMYFKHIWPFQSCETILNRCACSAMQCTANRSCWRRDEVTLNDG